MEKPMTINDNIEILHTGTLRVYGAVHKLYSVVAFRKCLVMENLEIKYIEDIDVIPKNETLPNLKIKFPIERAIVVANDFAHKSRQGPGN